jgi:hypothetical protein
VTGTVDQGRRSGTRWVRWLCLSLVVASSLVTAGCLTANQGLVSSRLSNGHYLYLQAYSTPCCGVIAVNATADVSNGTSGTLDVTGPVSWQCTGVFEGQPPTGDADASWMDLPGFTVSVDEGPGGGDLDFYAPRGTYRVQLTLTSPSGSISESVIGTSSSTGTAGSFATAGGSYGPDCTQSPAPSPAA